MDHRGVDKTIWLLEGVDENELEDTLVDNGVFAKIDDLFPAKINLFFEKRMKAKIEERKDAVKFLTKEKSHNISKFYIYTFLLCMTVEEKGTVVGFSR